MQTRFIAQDPNPVQNQRALLLFRLLPECFPALYLGAESLIIRNAKVPIEHPEAHTLVKVRK